MVHGAAAGNGEKSFYPRRSLSHCPVEVNARNAGDAC